MKLSEIIAACGDDLVEFQALDACADRLNWSSKTGLTTISFKTTAVMNDGGMVKLGLVVWLDREAVREAIAKGPQGKGEVK